VSFKLVMRQRFFYQILTGSNPVKALSSCNVTQHFGASNIRLKSSSSKKHKMLGHFHTSDAVLCKKTMHDLPQVKVPVSEAVFRGSNFEFPCLNRRYGKYWFHCMCCFYDDNVIFLIKCLLFYVSLKLVFHDFCVDLIWQVYWWSWT